MTFHVGQKVVCVDDHFYVEWHRPWAGSKTLPILPCAKRIYTVRDILEWRFREGLAIALYLVEIKNEVVRFSPLQIDEPPFSAHRFRPVIERSTDISIFTDMLIPSDQPAKVDPVRAETVATLHSDS